MSKAFEISHVNTAGALVVIASRAGAFKLPHYAQASQAYKTCMEVVEAGKSEEFKLESVNKQSLILVHNVLEFAANSNAFSISDYDTVLSVLVAFREHLEIKSEEKKDEGAEEEKKEA